MAKVTAGVGALATQNKKQQLMEKSERPQTLKDLIEIRMPEIQKVEACGEKRFRMWFEPDHEVSARIVHASIERNWELSEISVERRSLDEIFARLSGKN